MTLPGSLGYGAPQDPITKLVRDIEDLKRTVAQMQSLLVQSGTIQVNDTNSTTKIFYVGPTVIPDGSGRTQSELRLARDDNTAALAMGDFGTTPGHAHQQALQWFDRAGNVVVADDTASGQGLARPYLSIGTFTDMTVPTATTTNTTFTNLQSLVGYKQHPKVVMQVLMYADSGTTGAVQVIDQSGNVLGSQILTSGYFGYVTFGPIAIIGGHELPIALNIQGKVTSGSGKVGARGVSAVGIAT